MKRRRRTLVALPAAVLLAVSGIATAASGPVVVSGPSPYAACTIGGSGTNFTNAEVEPYVAANPANPKNVIGMWQQDRWSNGGSHGLVAGYTFDGGKTWGETALPYDRCAGGLPYERASDPWVSVGPDGTAYSNAIVFDDSGPNNGVAALTSTDGGKTWGNLSTIVSYSGTSQFFTDKNSITANPGRAGVAYSVWDTLVSPNDNPDANLHTSAYTGPGMFSATTDGGRTWSTPTVMFPTGSRNQTIGNQIVVDPQNPDVLYDFANWIVQPNNGNFTHSQLAFVKSVDGGANWSAPRAVFDMDSVGVSDPNTGAGVRTGDIIPEPAIGPDGSLYAVWQDGDFSGGAYDQIAFSTSKDGGATWSAPKQVNTPTGRAAFTPTVKVSSAGVVGITYYDFRNLAAGNVTSLPTDYWFTSSADGGATFSASRHLAGPFDMTAAPVAGGFFVGDYEGLATVGRTFMPFFVQSTCPVPSSGPCDTADRTDVYATTVAP